MIFSCIINSILSLLICGDPWLYNLKLREGSCPAPLYLLGGGDALLPGLCPGLGHADGGALGVGHCVALAVRDRVVHSLAQGAGRIVATVAVGAVSETIGF